MKTTRKIGLILTSFALASAVLITSCKKKDTTETPDTDTQAAQDNNLAEWVANDGVTMAGQASETGSVSYRMGEQNSILSSCASITPDPVAKTYTVTFAGGICADGHSRSGKLVFDYSGSSSGAVYYRNPGFKCTLTSYNYVVDNYSVAISHTVTNTTPNLNPGTNLTWSVLANVTITKPNQGGQITWSCNRTHTLLNTAPYTLGGVQYGAAYTDQNTVIKWTPNITNPTNDAAIIGISGSVNGTTAKGETYTFQTTSPLVVNMNCYPVTTRPSYHPIVQGAFDFTPGNKGVRHVDFGNGNCDLTCTVTITSTTGHTYGPYTVTIVP